LAHDLTAIGVTFTYTRKLFTRRGIFALTRSTGLTSTWRACGTPAAASRKACRRACRNSY